jgi:hypothetical protein
MTADNGPAWPRSGADGASMIERAVCSDFGGSVHPDSLKCGHQTSGMGSCALVKAQVV